MINNLENLAIESIEVIQLRPLRELMLHNCGVTLLLTADYDFALAKLIEINNEVIRRRV